MSRDEICAALHDFVKLHNDSAWGDALADLAALAWPDTPPWPHLGWGDPLFMLRDRIAVTLTGWDYVARQNVPAAAKYRDAARGLRTLLALAETSGRNGAR